MTSFPGEIPLAHQVQPVVRIALVEHSLLIDQCRIDVDVEHILAAFAERFDQFVGLDDLGALFPVVLGLSLGIHAVHREDALYVDLCPGRLLGEAVEQFPDVGGHLLGRHAGRQVVGADHQEQFLGMAVDDRIETVEQPSRTVGADAAVLDMAVVEQLGPLAAVGDAVPEKNDVVTPDRQLFEKAAFLIVVFVLGERCDRDEQSRGKENGFFHIRLLFF